MIKIIAEIGCNHNGDKYFAKMMIDEAKKCGVDAVKFQTFNSEALISKFAPKADYQKITTGEEESQLEMTRKLELPPKDYVELARYAKSIGLECFSTPFDLESIDFLCSMGQQTWKIPSGEITNLPYLEKIGSLNIENKEIILSSGMSTVEEIKVCINILVKAGTSRKSIILLHCNTEYPSPDRDINLNAIDDLHNQFPNIRIGFSDHSIGCTAAVGAATKNIVLIEKHFTLDKNLPGPDHKASATPEELRMICKNVRRIESMLGNCKKVVTDSERKNRVIARKSIVALVPIKKGDCFTEKNITCKRPGSGISPMYWYDIIGKKAEKNFEQDELICSTAFPMQME